MDISFTGEEERRLYPVAEFPPATVMISETELKKTHEGGSYDIDGINRAIGKVGMEPFHRSPLIQGGVLRTNCEGDMICSLVVPKGWSESVKVQVTVRVMLH